MGELLGYASLRLWQVFLCNVITNIGQPSKAGALEAFWAPVLEKTQSFLINLMLSPYGDN